MIKRVAQLVFMVARWLPASYVAAGGGTGKAVRAWCARRMLASCGSNPNVEHRAWFGDGSNLSLGANSGVGVRSVVLGPVSIGDNVMMGPDVYILAWNHAFSDLGSPMVEQGLAESRPIQIGDNVWIGARVIILPGVTVGDGAIIGAGAVVRRDIPSMAIAIGNPALVVKTRS